MAARLLVVILRLFYGQLGLFHAKKGDREMTDVIRRGRRAVGARSMRACAALAAATVMTKPVYGQNIEALWILPGDGAWSNSANWSTAPVVPNNSAENRFDVEIESGAVALDVDVDIDGLVLRNSIAGLNQLMVREHFEWLRGTISTGASNKVTVTGTANIDGQGLRYLYGNLDFGGRTTWRGADIGGGSDLRTITNRSQGVFEILGDVSLQVAHHGLYHFDNFGELRISVPTRSWFGNTALRNHGTLKVLSGEFATALDSPGSVYVEQGATLFVYGLETGTVLNRVSSMNGQGHVVVGSRTALEADVVFSGTIDNRDWLQVDADVELTKPFDLKAVHINGSLTVNETTIGGSVSGNGDFVVNGPLIWNVSPAAGARMTGSGRIIAKQGATFVTPPNFGSRTFVNHGHIVATDGIVGGTIDIQSGASLELPGDKPLMVNITNAGTFTRSSGAGMVEVGGVSNSGMFEVRSGGMRILGNGTSTGTFVFGPDTSLEIGRTSVSGTVLGLGGGASFMGPVSVKLNNGTLRADAAVTLPNLTFSGGTLDGAGDITIDGAFNWTAGGTAGSGKLILKGDTSIVGRRVVMRPIDNYGSMLWSGIGNLTWSRVATFRNHASGVFDARVDAIVGDVFAFGAPTFENAGVLRKSAGEGNTDLGVQFNNSGRAEAMSGRVRFLHSVNNSGTIVVGDGKAMAVFGSLTSNGKIEVGRGGTLYVAGGLPELAAMDLNGRFVVQPTASEGPLFGQLQAKIASARNGGARGPWSGEGITSSAARSDSLTGLAIILNDRGDGTPLFVENVMGKALDKNSIIIRYTYNGDANLDGKLNADDYFQIDSGFLAQVAEPGWRDGDFTYDGTINADDYFLIDSAFLGQGEPIVGTSASAAAAVPEPSGVSVVLLVGLLAGRRPRKS